MRAMHRFWTERGEIWAEDEYEVVDDGINWKTIAGVHLYLDGYRLGATLNPDGQLGLSVHAPCVRPANPEGLLARE